MFFFAQSPPPIDGVPSEFIKSALQLGGFAIVIGLLVYNTFFRGPQKREISGRIEHEEVPEFADAEDVEEMRHEVEKDKSAISGRIAAMQLSFADGLHALGKETLESMGVIQSMASRHDAMLEQMDRRLTSLEKSHNDSVQRLHTRIDDAMKRK